MPKAKPKKRRHPHHIRHARVPPPHVSPVMTEPAVIVAGDVDAPDLGAAAADAPASPATKA
jgi:hypothetical protein